jgi:hypothetical protein
MSWPVMFHTLKRPHWQKQHLNELNLFYSFISAFHKMFVSPFLTLLNNPKTQNLYRVIKKSLCTWWLQYTQLMRWRWPSQNTFGMWTMLYWTRPSRTQFGMSINVWRLVADTMNITCNFLYSNHWVHRDFLITLYNETIFFAVVCSKWHIFTNTTTNAQPNKFSCLQNFPVNWNFIPIIPCPFLSNCFLLAY